MGMPTITGGRILKGQMRGGLGEEFKLAMDKFPRVGLSRVSKYRNLESYHEALLIVIANNDVVKRCRKREPSFIP